MISTDAIEKFTAMVKRSAQARAKDIRIDLIDATVLMAEITTAMARLAMYEHATVRQHETTSVRMDGGKLEAK